MPCSLTPTQQSILTFPFLHVLTSFLFPPSSFLLPHPFQVVDDNLVNRVVAARFFSRYGAHVDTVGSGERALEALTRCNAAHDRTAGCGNGSAMRTDSATSADTVNPREKAIEVSLQCTDALAHVVKPESLTAGVTSGRSRDVMCGGDRCEGWEIEPEALTWQDATPESGNQSGQSSMADTRGTLRTPFASHTEGAAANGAADSWKEPAQGIVMAAPEGDCGDFDGRGQLACRGGSGGRESAMSEAYDFVFMDLQMPDMDG